MCGVLFGRTQCVQTVHLIFFLPQKWHFVRDVVEGVALNTSNQKPKIPFLKLKIKLHAR